MADRPILFSPPMVRAQLAGTKTQTRRRIDFPGVENVVEFVPVGHNRKTGVPQFEMKDANGRHVARPVGKHFIAYHWAPRFAVGDRLWVREAIDKVSEPGDVCYRADFTGDSRGLGWRPSIHMPRWASRLTLTVTEVRVQRLQDISDADARAEGAYIGKRSGRVADSHFAMAVAGEYFHTARGWYADLWDRINGPGAWAANPWVVALTFTVAQRNIDAEIAGGRDG